MAEKYCRFIVNFLTLKQLAMQNLFKKWWIILIQGILLILLSIYVFNHPGVTLISITFWLSLMILFAGIAGIIGWLMMSKSQRETDNLLWSVVSAAFGFLLIMKIGFAMDLLTNLLGIWMIITGSWLVRIGWAHKDGGSPGWLVLIAGLISIVAGVMVIFNIAAGAVAVSTLVGLQLLLSGIGLITLSLIKKKLVGSIKEGASKIKDQFQNR
jgi:uncharacterized membrane protein HdeD (DUF308 family)